MRADGVGKDKLEVVGLFSTERRLAPPFPPRERTVRNLSARLVEEFEEVSHVAPSPGTRPYGE